MQPWMWLALFLIVVAAQIGGMRSGMPLSRVVQRLTERSRAWSMFIAALVFWLGAHWFTSRATSVTEWDWIAIAVGLLVGALVHEKRRRKRIAEGRAPD